MSAGISLTAPRDSDIEDDRARGIRVTVALSIVIAVVGIPTVLGAFIGALFTPLAALILGTLGFALGGFLLLRIIDRLYVYNEEWAAYVTQNPINGNNIPYGPGLHASFPWEERNKEGKYSLKVIVGKIEIAVPTQTTKVTVKGNFQYRIDLPGINRYIGNSSEVEHALVGFIEKYLTEKLTAMDGEDARKTIKDISEDLQNEFTHEADFTGYGIRTVSLNLSAIVLPDDVQKTRDAVGESKTLMEVIAELAGLPLADYKLRRSEGKISFQEHKELMNRAMAVSGNNTSLNVNVMEGGGAVPTIAMPSSGH